MNDSEAKASEISMPTLDLHWAEKSEMKRASALVFVVDPVTVITVITAIVDKLQAAQKAKAEAEFRDQVLHRLEEIERQLVAIQKQLTEMGVLLLAAIGQVPVTQASGLLSGQFVALRASYPDLPQDRRRALQRFDDLNAAAATAAAYGPALLPQIATSFVALLIILQLAHEDDRRHESALRAAWLAGFTAMLDPRVEGSLTNQRSRLEALILEATRNLDQVPTGRFKLGTHNYTRTEVYIDVARVTADAFSINRHDVDLPPPQHHGGIGGDRHFAAQSRPGFASEAIAPSDLYLYFVGARALSPPAAIWQRFGNGDNHGSIYDGWIAEIYARVAENADLREAARACLSDLAHAIALAEKLRDFCSH